MSSMPNAIEFGAICRDTLLTDDYLLSKGIGKSKNCDGCKQEMKPRKRKGEYTGRYRCNKCGKDRSLFDETIFYQAKLSRGTILMIGYYWLNDATSSQIQNMLGLTDKTVKYWLDLFKLSIEGDIKSDENEGMIGGPDIVVEIDESKFGKRKYHRGHRVEGVWVLGGVERTPERRIFAVTVPDRTEETLLRVIRRYVHPGSIIHTDCWRGYNTEHLNELEYLHSTVNHSEHYKDPITGCHTNTIEGTWRGIKMKVPASQRREKLVDPYLLTFVWKRRNAKDLWNSFLNAINNCYVNLEEHILA